MECDLCRGRAARISARPQRGRTSAEEHTSRVPGGTKVGRASRCAHGIRGCEIRGCTGSAVTGSAVGKSAQLAMFGVTFEINRSGQISSTITHVCTGRSLQCGRVRGARASKTRKWGVNQRTVEFLGGQTRFFGFPVCYLGQNHRSSHLPGEDRLRSRVEKTEP